MKQFLSIAALLLYSSVTFASDLAAPIVGDNVIFEETGGMVTVEAEFFYKQSKSEIRQWYRTSKKEVPSAGRDLDEPHVAGASNGAYIEILPDTRTTHADKLIGGENFSNEPGKLAVVHYKVHFNTPGKYYVWVRAYSGGAEDNGLHVGVNGDWPESGQRLQWCDWKNSWRWESKQRTDKVHCGEPYLIFLEIKEAGLHDIQFSLREDGFEFDKFIMTTDREYIPEVGVGPDVRVKSGTLPEPYLFIPAESLAYMDKLERAITGTKVMKAPDFPVEATNFYINESWLAINPSEHKEAKTSMEFPFKDGAYDIVFGAVGENDGKSEYKVWVNDRQIGSHVVPMSESNSDEGPKYNALWENIKLKQGDKITVHSKTGSIDGQKSSRGRWSGIAFTWVSSGKKLMATERDIITSAPVRLLKAPELPFSDQQKRGPDGDGSVEIAGELKQWHKVTLTLDGPFAHELDKDPNAFTDYNMMVKFSHESGTPTYNVPGYFAADGNAGETGADAGTKWRAHLSPDKAGKWLYTVTFKKGKNAAQDFAGEKITMYSDLSGEFTIDESDKTGRDFRSKGRLEYIGRHHLQFQGNKEFFVKAGPDAPETLLAYKDFDATYSLKSAGPLKSYEKHVVDWKEGYPTWQNGKGKGLIGAIAYLSDKGLNGFSFLSYNAGGDGYNVWPFVRHDAKLHYDCSKLDQWGIVFDFAQHKGLHLHFKLQENEMDDNNKGDFKGVIKEALDGGDLGPERKLYLRELIARYGYQLALNWNIGEENTQSVKQQQEMIAYISKIQPYNHNIVIHTFPDQQEKVYTPLLGDNSLLTGTSLQNHWDQAFKWTLKWREASAKAGRPWVVANDEQGKADEGVPPDPGYAGFNPNQINYDLHDIRKQTLYGNLMAGGAGVEYYFGYKLVEHDLIAEDFRSRDKTWDFCRIGIDFFRENIPFQDMDNADALVGNTNGDKGKHCLAQEGKVYLVYLAYEKTTSLDLSGAKGSFKVKWFNPRTGGEFQSTAISKVKGGKVVELGNPPVDDGEDWLVLISK